MNLEHSGRNATMEASENGLKNTVARHSHVSSWNATLYSYLAAGKQLSWNPADALWTVTLTWMAARCSGVRP